MPKPTRAKAFRDLISQESSRFRGFFRGLPPLLTGSGANLAAALAYEFHLIETAHHRILYGCLCRIHDANSVLAKNAVNSQHMTRDKFRSLFKNVVGVEISDAIIGKGVSAEKHRDNMIHGKSVSDADMWRAIQSLTEYAKDINGLVVGQAHFEAFGDMRGVVGRRGGQPLNAATTRWLLKGMGFDIS